MSIGKSVAIALMSQGILDRDQVDEAAELLSGPLDKMAKAEAAEKAALLDEVRLTDVVLHAKELAAEDEAKGDLLDEAAEEHVIEDAAERRLDDESVIELSEQAIDEAFEDATKALVDAELIDASQAGEVTTAIVGVWKQHS